MNQNPGPGVKGWVGVGARVHTELGSCRKRMKLKRTSTFQGSTIWLRILFAKLMNIRRGVDFVKSSVLGLCGACRLARWRI